MSNSIVQEPPDVPKWVEDLEDGYQCLTTSILRCNHDFYHVNKRVRNLNVHSIKGNFDQDLSHKNAHQFAAAVFKNLGEELSVKSVNVEIPASDLPETILPMNVNDFKDPLSFSPIKLYQYLLSKYAGKNASNLVQGDVSKNFTNHFGHGRWAFEDRGTETVRVPKLDRFIDEGFKQEKNFYIGHLTTTIDEHNLSPIAGMINWKYDSRSYVAKALRNLADLLLLADQDQELVEWVNKMAKTVEENTNGQSIPYSHKIGGRDLGFIFRKAKLEVRFSVELLDIIRTFLLNHHPDFKRAQS